ncbi:MAG: hypothetical protein NZ602_06590 [Thermoguttaceae bacterium]|nr:hypothetical protein [Thermoguttaceae bacterium]MDW8036949.1 SAM-dependent methyltransferase [Thermoguttaceae bacterium]
MSLVAAVVEGMDASKPAYTGFLFATCQVGAEQALVGEIARCCPGWRPAFRRPGFVTFKAPADWQPEPGWLWDKPLIFALASGLSYGGVQGKSAEELAQKWWALAHHLPFHRVHVWQRETEPRGSRPDDAPLGWQTPLAQVARQALQQACPWLPPVGVAAFDPTQPAAFGDLVLDCIVVDENHWFVGYHQARSPASRYPGGIFPLELPEHAVSRAWLKMEEALRWSGLPIRPGARCVELGSAPGGSSQALLDRGMYVLGIDPAEMHPAVLQHPRFTHLRRRSTQTPRRALRKVRWLFSDMNVAPNYTLTAVEAIVTHPQINIRGMILMLKLTRWQLAERIPDWLRRIRSWGYNEVQARQLYYNRQEICVAALQRPFRRKPPRKK